MTVHRAGAIADRIQYHGNEGQGLKAPRNSLLPAYCVKMLDGNCIAKTEHRLEVLRHTNAGPLPGKSLAIYDHALDMVVDVRLHELLPIEPLDMIRSVGETDTGVPPCDADCFTASQSCAIFRP